jgi:hypothetical protein
LSSALAMRHMGWASFYCLALSLVAAGAPSAANAQEASIQESGPLLSAALRVTHHSNVVHGNSVTAAARGLTPEDVVIQPKLSVNLDRALGRERVFLHADVGYDFYTRNSILNRENIATSGGVSSDLHICAVTTDGGYARHQSDLAEVGLVQAVNVETLLNARMSASCLPASVLSPFFSFQWSQTRNTAISRKPSDSDNIGAQGGVRYRMGSFGSVGGNVGWQHVTFPDVLPALAGTTQGGYNLYDAELTAKRELGTRLSFDVGIGYNKVVSDSVGIPDFGGATYKFEGTYEPSSRLHFVASYDHSVKPERRFGAGYSLTSLVSVGASYKIGPRGSFSLQASQRKRDPRGTSTVGAAAERERTDIVSATLRYDLATHANVGMDVEREERHAEIATFNYSDTRIGIFISSAF